MITTFLEVSCLYAEPFFCGILPIKWLNYIWCFERHDNRGNKCNTLAIPHIYNILIFDVCAIDNIVALLCDWIVFLDYWNFRKWDVTIGYLSMFKLLIFKLKPRKNKDNLDKILWSNNGQLINGLNVNNWVLVWKEKLEAWNKISN